MIKANIIIYNNNNNDTWENCQIINNKYFDISIDVFNISNKNAYQDFRMIKS